MPKLELNAALLSFRVAAAIQNCLIHPISRTYFWTDSSTVRNWIRATASFNQIFVANRVGEIQTLTESDEWHFIPGKLNPADAATRSAIGEDVWPWIWQDGPEFLLQLESAWPTDLPWMAATVELKATKSYHVQITPDPFDWSAVSLDHSYLSSFLKLEGETKNLLKRCQSEAFPEDLTRLKRGKLLRSSSYLLALSPKLGEAEILRLGGRIDRAKLPYDARHPPLLPSKHPLTEKIVEVVHGQMHHAGTDYLFAKLCRHFWVIRGRELSDKAVSALFTCLATRAVHIELAESLSSEDFLLVFRRFIGLFGKPATVQSDNGTNFVGAERELNDLVNQLGKDPKLSQFRKEKMIDYTNQSFQPPRALHFGGAHESFVRSTKRAFPRKKWKSAQENLSVGDIVLLLDPNQPCGLWKIGHVNQVYPGNEGLVRVVKVRTKDGEYTRAIHRLSILKKAAVADVHPKESLPPSSK
ncbi:uncharacterized protein LOC123477439 [Daphnia magna]|uniref:uncharacterized protein LOC123477439 n=1 Tax=Daphnia magna TaxID=35525 RepID=UPI001E1BC451|nr:uncharacterized protein LOC123477439 [Daphnia magna]